MSHKKTHLKLFALFACLFCCTNLCAINNDELMRLEADMLKYFSTEDKETFYKTTNRVEEVSKEAGKERLYYKAWGNQAIYEAIHQNFQKALDIAQDILDYARDNHSIFGEYAALHTKATIQLHEQDYDAAEAAYLKAVDFHHKHFPNESAGEDLQELMKIANHRKDVKAGAKYARQILEETNVEPIHKGRALYWLSEMAFNQNDVKEFNRLYEEMMKQKNSDVIGTLRPLVELNYYIINGNYGEALRLADQLGEEEKAERKAAIYHRMGDDGKAYQYLLAYKTINDSITQVSQGNVMTNYYVQMNNERMKLEQQLLQNQNAQLRHRIYLTIGIAFVIILMLILYQRQKTVKRLLGSIKSMSYEKKDTERALKEIAELSSYESQPSLALTTTIQPTVMCNRLASAKQAHCRRGVTILFLSELTNDFVIKSNRNALEKLLTHLLENAVLFTRKGTITLKCIETGENVMFTVSDASSKNSKNTQKGGIFGGFDESSEKIHTIGLSYNICQSIIRLLHGRIWIDKEYSDGVRFCLEIPKDPQKGYA